VLHKGRPVQRVCSVVHYPGVLQQLCSSPSARRVSLQHAPDKVLGLYRHVPPELAMEVVVSLDDRAEQAARRLGVERGVPACNV
jgi:hypothetical protein